MPPYSSERCSIPGTSNVRDIGGLKANKGMQVVTHGMVFRGDHLHLVDEVDAKEILVEELKIHRTYDLRGTASPIFLSAVQDVVEQKGGIQKFAVNEMGLSEDILISLRNLLLE